MNDCIMAGFKKPTLLLRTLLILVQLSAIGYSQSIAKADYAAELENNLQASYMIVYKKFGEKELRLHVFVPPGQTAGDKRPCFVAFHGGGWVRGKPGRFYPIVNEFVKKGMVGISAEYRLLQEDSSYTVFDCVKDGRSAIRYIRKYAWELGVDTGQIIVSGGSAGAHIAAGTAMFDHIDEVTDQLEISSIPNALVLYYPVIDTSPEGFGSKKIGDQWMQLSPLHQIRKGIPPTLIFHGSDDTITPVAGAKKFHAAMLLNKNICELVVKKGGGHGYMMFEKAYYDEAIQKTTDFLKDRGFGMD